MKLTIRFYEELNDFLPADKRKHRFNHTIVSQSSVKDLIESLGVPHTEIDLILVNGQSVTFKYIVKDNDDISVFPTFESLNIKGVTCLRPQPLRITKFILDVHLGKLTKYLRLLGFDCSYYHLANDPEIIDKSLSEKRIILTRDVGLLKNSKVTHGYFVRSTKVETQVQEILNRFDLYDKYAPFTRCLECNGKLIQVKKDHIEEFLPKEVKISFDKFMKCVACNRVYWEGSHFDKLNKRVKQFCK